MKHISEIIEDILVEWKYRVHDGMPNPKMHNISTNFVNQWKN